MSDALDLLYALRLEDGRRCGDVAYAFQREDAAHVLDVGSAMPYSFFTRSRGSSKTADEGGVATVAMLAQLAPGSRLYGLAADRDQGRLLVDSIAGYAARTPELQNALRIDAYKSDGNEERLGVRGARRRCTWRVGSPSGLPRNRRARDVA